MSPITEKVTTQEVAQMLPDVYMAIDTTFEGHIVDTRAYSEGVYFLMVVPECSGGTVTMKLEHGDDPALSDAEDIPEDNLVYKTTIAVSSAVSPGTLVPRQGVFNTKRYVRASAVGSGGATLTVFIFGVFNPSYSRPTQQGG